MNRIDVQKLVPIPIALGIGIFAFIFITGAKVIWPEHFRWLMQGDPATHFLGWLFFRYTPFLQWPLGLNGNYGLEIGNSIVFTDSIPLLAFLFKPFSQWLPENFQYFGLWILLCFLLQAIFAFKLLSRFLPQSIALACATFFVIAPPFLFRFHGHTALAGHWLLLAGLWLYFSPQFQKWGWGVLLSLGVLIHAYLAAMVMAIWGADLLQRAWRKERSFVWLIIYAVCTILVVIGVMGTAGYFSVSSSVGGGGYGLYRMNLLSLIDSGGGLESWSTLLPNFAGGEGDYEGMNFLGTGLLVFAGLACIRAFRSKLPFTGSVVGPLIIVGSFLTIFAISNHIAWGGTELAAIKLPKSIERAAAILRSSGRMFWPVYYMLYVLIFVLALKKLKPQIAISICVLILCLQVFDSRIALANLRARFDQTWQTPLQSAVWTDIARHYKKVAIVLPDNQPPNYVPVAYFAGSHHMAVNSGYFARVDDRKVRALQSKVNEAVRLGQFEPDTLYVFNAPYLWNIALETKSDGDVASVVDGFRILAPRAKPFTSASSSLANLQQGEIYYPTYDGDWVSFDGGSGEQFLGLGWRLPITKGVLGRGQEAILLAQLSSISTKDYLLEIEGAGFLDRQRPVNEISVSVNGVDVGVITYDRKNRQGIRRFIVPATALANDMGRAVIQFKPIAKNSSNSAAPDLEFILTKFRLAPNPEQKSKASR